MSSLVIQESWCCFFHYVIQMCFTLKIIDCCFCYIILVFKSGFIELNQSSSKLIITNHHNPIMRWYKETTWHIYPGLLTRSYMQTFMNTIASSLLQNAGSSQIHHYIIWSYIIVIPDYITMLQQNSYPSVVISFD